MYLEVVKLEPVNPKMLYFMMISHFIIRMYPLKSILAGTNIVILSPITPAIAGLYLISIAFSILLLSAFLYS